RIFTSSFVNEIRGGIFTSEVPFDRTDALPDYFFTNTIVTVPENTFLNQGRNTKGINYQDNADWVWKSHTFKFGGQLQYFKVNAYNDAGVVPTVTVGGTGTPQLTAGNFTSI